MLHGFVGVGLGLMVPAIAPTLQRYNTLAHLGSSRQFRIVYVAIIAKGEKYTENIASNRLFLLWYFFYLGSSQLDKLWHRS